ncbi:MAG: AtpZ/AtpI family protein [Aurantibacter sp.]
MSSNKKSQLNTYAKFSGIAFQMVAIIGLGSYGGVKLDELYPDLYPTFTLICSLASVAIAMYLVIKQVGGNSKNNEVDD